MNNRADAITAFLHQHLKDPVQHPLAGDASFRRYIRVHSDGRTFMMMDAPPERENIGPFMNVCDLLGKAGYSAPQMLAHDRAQGFLLLEDLGDDTFSRLLRQDISQEKTFYEAAIEVLAAWHNAHFAAGDATLAPYDHALLVQEIRLFSNWFLPQFLDGAALEEAQASYLRVWEGILANAPLATDQFVHRDYHADNLMWLPERNGTAKVGLLDFQDAVAGDAAYDMVSLLEDARRDVPLALVSHLRAHYLALTGADTQRFSTAYAILAAQRNSKIIGIFTRLGARDGKMHYLKLLPRVWGHLQHDLEHPALSNLKEWIALYVPVAVRGEIDIRKDARALGLAA